MADHGRLAVDDRDKPGTRPQEGRLAGAVRALYEDDLARGDVEVDAGQGGEAAEEGNGGVQMDGDSVHGNARGYRGVFRTIQAPRGVPRGQTAGAVASEPWVCDGWLRGSAAP